MLGVWLRCRSPRAQLCLSATLSASLRLQTGQSLKGSAICGWLISGSGLLPPRCSAWSRRGTCRELVEAHCPLDTWRLPLLVVPLLLGQVQSYLAAGCTERLLWPRQPFQESSESGLLDAAGECGTDFKSC